MENKEIMDRLDSLSKQITEISETVNGKSENKEEKKNDICWPLSILKWLWWLWFMFLGWDTIVFFLMCYKVGDIEIASLFGITMIAFTVIFKNVTKNMLRPERLSDYEQREKNKKKEEKKHRKELKKQGKIGEMQAYLEKNGYCVTKEEE
jgi:hypothetical protein